MNDPISADTQAVLLLCSRLGQRDANGVKPLTAKQYTGLARWLRDRSMRPGDFLDAQGRARLGEIDVVGLDRNVVEQLLERGVALGMMADRWASRGLWVLSRADDGYPARFKSYLGSAAPPLLFGVGDRKLLHRGGLAVVGSRDASEEDSEFARRVASVCASQNIGVISGGARGIDMESMVAACNADGSAIGVLSDSLAQAAVSAQYRESITAERLALISPFDPDAGWAAFAAMDRNKLIYALSDAALVVTSSSETGGTWAGATEALQHGHIAIYVKASGSVASGNRKLLPWGARPFPAEPWSDLRSLFVQVDPATEPALAPSPVSEATGPATAAVAVTESRTADAYALVLPAMLAALSRPGTEKTVEEALGLVPAQAKAWLKRACEEGRLQKLGRPLRYVAAREPLSLFDDPQGKDGDFQPLSSS